MAKLGMPESIGTKKIILVKLKTSNEIPEELLGESREDVVGLELDKINRAISNLMMH